MDEYADTVTFYIFCEDVCIPKIVTVRYNSDNPWFTKELRVFRAAKDWTFRSVEGEEFRNTKWQFNVAIREAKAVYMKWLDKDFSTNNSRQK